MEVPVSLTFTLSRQAVTTMYILTQKKRDFVPKLIGELEDIESSNSPWGFMYPVANRKRYGAGLIAPRPPLVKNLR